MTPTQKTVLIAGLGKFIDKAPASAQGWYKPDDKMYEQLASQIQQAREHGIDTTSIDFDPSSPKDSIAQFEEALKSRKFDGFIMGYGIRGNKEFTSHFEDLVNLSREVSPSTKFGFSPAPDKVWETIERMFPDVAEKDCAAT